MGISGRAKGGRRMLATLLFVSAALSALPVGKLRAQVLPATAGAVGGFFAGAIMTTGVVVLQARMGKFIYGMDEFLTVRPELLPIVVVPVAGAVLGATSQETLRDAAVGALVGGAGGAAVGAAIGTILWQTEDGRWAGGIIGAATGILVGSVVNGVRGARSRDNNDSQIPLASISLKVPWGG